MDRNMKGKTPEAQMRRAGHVAGTTTATDKYHQPSAGDKIVLELLRFKKRDLTKKKQGGK
jgi:hypothetical protein